MSIVVIVPTILAACRFISEEVTVRKRECNLLKTYLLSSESNEFHFKNSKQSNEKYYNKQKVGSSIIIKKYSDQQQWNAKIIHYEWIESKSIIRSECILEFNKVCFFSCVRLNGMKKIVKHE